MNIGQSRIQSRFFFEVPDDGQHENVGVFRDPAAVPMLRTVATALADKGFAVTEPKPTKASHAACSILLPLLRVSLVLLVERSNGRIMFDLLTWPAQSITQRLLHRRLRSPGDCDEWQSVCTAVGEILKEDPRLLSLTSTTFAEGENKYRAG